MNLADADNMKLVKAILEGLNKRIKTASRTPIFIQTSGTSLLNGSIPEDIKGDKEYNKVYSDKKVDEIWNLPVSFPHHDVDLAALEATKSGIKFYIVIPPTIHGVSKHALNPLSIQIPSLIRAALSRGQAGVVGTGANSWSYVHVEDLADAYVLILEGAVSGKAPEGRNGVYFASKGWYKHSEMALKIAEVLHKLAPEIVQTTTISPFGPEEISKYLFGEFVGIVFGGNSCCTADNTMSLGWKPERPNVYETLEEEAKLIVDEWKAGKVRTVTQSLSQ